MHAGDASVALAGEAMRDAVALGPLWVWYEFIILASPYKRHTVQVSVLFTSREPRLGRSNIFPSCRSLVTCCFSCPCGSGSWRLLPPLSHCLQTPQLKSPVPLFSLPCPVTGSSLLLTSELVEKVHTASLESLKICSLGGTTS